MQKDPHCVDSQTLCPTQFKVDSLRVEGIGLPHLQLIDRVRRDIVASHRPRLSGIPGLGLIGCPAFLAMAGAAISMLVSTATGQESFLNSLSINTLSLWNDCAMLFCHAMNSADMVQLHHLVRWAANSRGLPLGNPSPEQISE